MTRAGMCAVAIMCVSVAGPAWAHHPASVLGTVRIPDRVMMGTTLVEPGTYEIRLTGDHLAPLPGQSEEAAQGIELFRGATSIARDAAEVLTAADRPVGTSGGSGARARVERLKGDEFLRVSIVKDGERYLIHMPIVK